MDDKSNIYNIHLCRICQDPKKLDLISISNPSKHKNVKACWDTLKNIFYNIIWVEDRLISLVCKICLGKVYEIADFQKMCLESNRKRKEFNNKYIEIVNNTTFNDLTNNPRDVPEFVQSEPTAQTEKLLLQFNDEVTVKTEQVNDSIPTTTEDFLQEEISLIDEHLNSKNNMVANAVISAERKRRIKFDEPKAKLARIQKYNNVTIIYAKLSEYVPVHIPRSNETVCNVCRSIFQTSLELRDHLRTQHSQLIPRRYRCEFCHIGFTTASDFQQHYIRVIHEKDYIPVQCHTCSCKTIRKQAAKPMQCHCPVKQTTTEDTALKMDVEERATTESEPMIEEHNCGGKRYHCYKCRNTFLTRNLLLNHAHSSHQFNCGFCLEPFSNCEEFLEHKANHGTNYNASSKLERKVMYCYLCKSIFSTKDGLVEHVSSRHCLNKYGTCGVCGDVLHEDVFKRHLIMRHSIKDEECQSHFMQQYQKERPPIKYEHYCECNLCNRLIHIAEIKSHLTHTHNVDVHADGFQVENFSTNRDVTQHEAEHSYSLKL